MEVDPKTDRIGGTASLLFGLVCLVFAYWDRQAHQNIWKVWAGIFLLLVLNAVGMFLHANRTSAQRALHP